MDDDDDDFLLDLLTYTCPITGRKRCAAGEPLRWIMLSLFTDAVVQYGFLMSCISSLKTANCFRTHLPRKRPCSPPKPKPPCRDAQAVEDLDESCLQQLFVCPCIEICYIACQLDYIFKIFLTCDVRIYISIYTPTAHQDTKRKEVLALLHDVHQMSFVEPPWDELRHCLIYKHIPAKITQFTTCGKILAHSRQKASAFRERHGSALCVFKIGVTANPAQRFIQYLQKNFTSMWIIFMSDDLSLVHMLEASLIALFSDIRGCRNSPNTGGEGALNRSGHHEPPFFVYIVGGRADQRKNVG